MVHGVAKSWTLVKRLSTAWHPQGSFQPILTIPDTRHATEEEGLGRVGAVFPQDFIERAPSWAQSSSQPPLPTFQIFQS